MPQQEAYLQRLLDSLSQISEEKDGWCSLCPNPQHSGGQGDSNPSLRISVGEEGRLLLRCRVGCSTKDILDSIGFTFRDLWPAPGEDPAQTLSQEPHEPSKDEILCRDKVYNDFLDLLPLGQSELTSLLHRGLSKESIKRNKYRTLKQVGLNPLLRKLHQKHGDLLLAIPGFRPGGLTLKDEGTLIPCRDLKGRIVALKLRRKDKHASPRYLYLSGGPVSCGAVLHSSLCDEHTDLVTTETVRITEGELKADVCTQLTGVLTLGLPGVGSYARSIQWITDLPVQPKTVLVAFDWHDVENKTPVQGCFRELVRLLFEAGYEVKAETWSHEPDHKGLDDLLAAKKVAQILEGSELKSYGSIAQNQNIHIPMWVRWDWEPLPFPVQALPAPVADFCTKLAESTVTPVDYAACASLSAAAAAVGPTRKLRLRETWSEYCSLYVALVGDSGSRKSSVLGNVSEPITRKQRDEFAGKSIDEIEDLAHSYTTNCTVESLVSLLGKSPRGLFIYLDEFMSWIQGNDQYKGGKGNDRQFYLSTWSCSDYKLDRKTSGSTYLRNPFLSIVGGMTPGSIQSMVSLKEQNDGFLQRLLFAIPAPSPRGKVPANTLDPMTKGLWSLLIDKLYSYEFDPDGDAIPVTWTVGAEKAFWNWYVEHDLEPGQKSFPVTLRGTWAKFLGYLPRIALLLRLMDDSNIDGIDPVTEDDIHNAIAIVDYFKHTAVGMFCQLTSRTEDTQVRHLYETCLSLPNQQITLRDFRKLCGIKTLSDTAKVLTRAVDLGLGQMLNSDDMVRGEKTKVFKAYCRDLEW